MTEEKKQAILARVDHTLLKPTATWSQIQKLCDEAIQYRTASVCIPPSYVGPVRAAYGENPVICTVIGFPLGYSTTAIKLFEARNALSNGASELDVVINIGDVKNGDWKALETELKALRNETEGSILKVIVETCYLDEAEKVKLCHLVTDVGADFIKTSTGFGTAGAKLEDIGLFRANIGRNVRIKAAGGMHSAAEFEAFYDAGADRLGASAAVEALKEKQNDAH